MDKLSRGTALNGNVRVFCCNNTALVQEAVTKHDLYPTAAAALGRTLSVACIMGSMLKDSKEKLEIVIDGNGPIGQVVVDGYYDGSVRGYVDNPHVQFEKENHKLDVGKAVGTDGVLRVVKDLSMKRPFISEVPLQSGEIGDDFAYYFAESEQTNSAVSVGVLVDTDCSIKSAGALIIQMMPSAVEADIQIVENIVTHLKPVSQIINEMQDPGEIAKAIFSDYEELETRELQFKCECSRARFARVLSKLPEKDLQEMIDEDHGCEVVCKFCGRKYRFSEETLQGYVNAHKARRESKEKKNEA